MLLSLQKLSFIPQGLILKSIKALSMVHVAEQRALVLVAIGEIDDLAGL
jgi:hypothetical protein